jgi:ribonuclease R
MYQDNYKPMTAADLVVALAVADANKFLQLLREMERAGEIICTRKNRYGLPEKMGMVTGRFSGHPRGFGFVTPDKGPQTDIYINASHTNGAMHQDRVMIRLTGLGGQEAKPEGEVIRVLKRVHRQIVGTYIRSRRIGMVVPDDPRLPQDVMVTPGNHRGAKNGDKVVVTITRWPENRHSLRGKVVEVLGKTGEPGVDIKCVLKKHDLLEQFPPRVLREAQAIPETINEAELCGRRDLRGWQLVTIDGVDAKDLDDAVSIKRLNNGNYYLGVHIADVGYYVPENSALDKEALRRGTSVYFPGQVIPMLPPRLSNGICSLNAGEDRLALSVGMEVDSRGRVTRYDIFPSVIRVAARLSYTAVRKILVEQDPEGCACYRQFVSDLGLMEKLALILQHRRRERGALDFNLPETKVFLDAYGKPEQIARYDRSIAEQIIEEFMLLANETVAQHFWRLEIPFVYRVHEKPDTECIRALNMFLQPLGYRVRSSGGGASPRAVQKVLEGVSGRPEEKVVQTVVLRAMQHARYDASCLGHFGLAAKYYCHFTSPIRRYADLAIHRVIRELLFHNTLAPQRVAKLAANMPVYATKASLTEKVAEEVEREIVDLKKIEYMERHLGACFPGIISGVMPFGLFVELENTVEGLIHVSTLADDYYEYRQEELSLVGQYTRKRYRIGDAVQIQVCRVDLPKRQLDFELVGS